MENRFTLNVEKALEEKRQMQKIFVREKGYPSSVLEVVIKHFESMEG